MKKDLISVRDLRKQWGISRKDFAARYGLSYNTVAGWESHTRNTLPLTIFKLIQELKDSDIEELDRLGDYNGVEAPKKLRKMKGLTQAEFAKELGTTQTTISNWENYGAPYKIQRLCQDILNHYLQ